MARSPRYRPYRGAGLLWMASVAPGLATFFWLLPRHFLSASAGNIAALAIATLAALILIVAVLWVCASSSGLSSSVPPQQAREWRS